MFKFAVFVLLLGVAQADLDKFLGKAVPVMRSPDIKKYGTGCEWSIASKVNGVQCTCGDLTNVSLVSYKLESGNVPEQFFAVTEINTYAEAEEALKTKTCKCGDKVYPFLAVKEVDVNFFISYAAPIEPNVYTTIFINVRSLPTQNDLDEALKSIPQMKDRTDYVVLCGFH